MVAAFSCASPPTVEGASIATVVGLLAMFVLSDTVAAGPAQVEVEDKTYEASAAYSARYGYAPQSLTVSLAGSMFSNAPTIEPTLRKAGDMIYTESNVNGMRMVWLAMSNEPQRKAALHVQRFMRKDAPCASMKLTLDGRELVLTSKSKTDHASGMLRQTVRADLDWQTIQAVASAKHALVDVCGTVRAFSALALRAAVNFSNAYGTLRAKVAVAPAAPTAAVSPEPEPEAARVQ